MGVVFSSIWTLFQGIKEVKVVMVGLDNAGKTSILYRLHLGQATSVYPTIGSNVEELVFKNVRMCVWDLGGQRDLREMWRLYYIEADGLIMVVDSSDEERFDTAREELHAALGSGELDNAVVLIYANKQDLSTSLSVSEISDALALYTIRTQPWHIQPCSAVSGDGLRDGLAWLAEALQEKRNT